MAEGPDRRAIVLRFPPGGPDEAKQVLKEAKYIHRHHQAVAAEPWFRLSVWADVPRDGESRLDVVRRLLIAAHMSGIRVDDERNSILWLANAGDMIDAGFTFDKDGESGEADEHYSVVLGHMPDRSVAERFVGLFKRRDADEGESHDDEGSD